jgi:hypothetical protein
MRVSDQETRQDGEEYRMACQIGVNVGGTFSPRRGWACRPATPTSSPAPCGTSFDVSPIATGGPALSAEKDIAYGVPLSVPLDFIP